MSFSRERAFSDLSSNEKIARSSVILRTNYEEELTDGELVQIVTEILKVADGVELTYEVGDEYLSPYSGRTTWRGPDIEYGDGQIIFFEGSPPQFRYGATYRTHPATEIPETIDAVGMMTIEDLRAAITADAGGQNKSP